MLTMTRNDGVASSIPVSRLYEGSDFTDWENMALSRCSGKVLDAGAGAGRHAVTLRARGLDVVAVDIDPALAELLTARGLDHVVTADALASTGERFDTVLMLMNGIGMTGTPARLDDFLLRLPAMLQDGGQLLCDSVDILASNDPVRYEYGRANQAAGRSPGQHVYTISYAGEEGPPFEWLHLSPGLLAEHCIKAGLAMELLYKADNGHFLARITIF
ncbi:methyltransferase domain-containing protein [Duganella sp. HSC-15S17]|nr:methyltransferase domain-containing protein [Duganella violaceicalia]MBV6325084.1 methyltransferase domain-containing protein [Duganella violaceicalia]